MKHSYEIDDLIYPILKEYGFHKKDKWSKILYLDNRFEFKTESGNQVGSKKLKFILSDMTKRNPGFHWGGWVSQLELDYNFDDNIILSTISSWLNSIFELEEMQPYSRTLKINKLKDNVNIL
jgi:hypothetical protein